MAGGPACELNVGEEVLGGGRGRTVGMVCRGGWAYGVGWWGVREFCERIGDWC